MIKQIKFFLLIFLIFFFINKVILSETERPLTQEEQREKHLGLKEKDRDIKSVKKQKLIKEIEMGNIDKIKTFLINNGNSINFIVDGLNPLTHAATVNNVSVIKLFLTETEINIDAIDERGNTALINASAKGHLEIIDYLINNGADLNHQNKQGITSIMKAAERSNYYAIKLLLDKNADISMSDYTGRTLREIAENNRDKRILKLLN